MSEEPIQRGPSDVQKATVEAKVGEAIDELFRKPDAAREASEGQETPSEEDICGGECCPDCDNALCEHHMGEYEPEFVMDDIVNGVVPADEEQEETEE